MYPLVYDALLTLPGHVPASTLSGVPSTLFVYFIFIFIYLLTFFFHRVFVLPLLYILPHIMSHLYSLDMSLPLPQVESLAHYWLILFLFLFIYWPFFYRAFVLPSLYVLLYTMPCWPSLDMSLPPYQVESLVDHLHIFFFFLVIYWPISFHRIFVLVLIHLLLYDGLSTLPEMSTLSSLVTICISCLFLIYCTFPLIYWQTSCRSLLTLCLLFGIIVHGLFSYVAAKNLYNFLLLYVK